MNSKEAADKVRELLATGNEAKDREDYLTALAAYNTALGLCKFLTPDCKYLISTVHNQIGNIYLKTGRYPKALKEFEQSLDIDLKIHNGKSNIDLIRDYNNLSVTYYQMGETEKAEEYIYKAYEVLSSMKPEEQAKYKHIDTLYNSLGLVHHEKKEFDTAIKFYLKAIDHILQKGGIEMYKHLATTYFNIGMAYFESGNTYEALPYLHKSEEIFKNIKSYDLFYVYSCLIDVYEAKGDKDKVNYYKSLINKFVNFVLD